MAILSLLQAEITVIKPDGTKKTIEYYKEKPTMKIYKDATRVTIYKYSDIELWEDENKKRTWIKTDHQIGEKGFTVSVLTNEIVARLIPDLKIDNLTKKNSRVNVRNQYTLYYIKEENKEAQWELYDIKNKKKIDINQKTAERTYNIKSRVVNSGATAPIKQAL